MKLIGQRHWFRLAMAAMILVTRTSAEKQKRQIFREQLIPALGGKIPEEAFRTDRLALNRLNKEGITVPDGVVLDARHVHKHPHPVQGMPEVIKVYLTPDGRYVPPEGRFHYNHPKTVDTTYVIRMPYTRGNHKFSNNFGNKHRGFGKPQSYTNFRQYLPFVPPRKPGVYKPIVTPLVLPAGAEVLQDQYVPSWNIDYDWENVYEPFDDYFINNIALFNSHQIIADYQGFINEFHERSSRHVDPKPTDRNKYFPSEDRKRDPRPTGSTNFRSTSYQKIRSNTAANRNLAYTNLTKIPQTSFSCRGRKGMFADVETKCQVFYNCSGWSRTSSLCPQGTAFSEEKKRCEWWNTVECK